MWETNPPPGVKEPLEWFLLTDVPVTDMAQAAAMARAALDAYGRIDALVNNAALYGALRGGRFNTIAEASYALLSEARPIDDIRSTAKYRAAVAANLLEEFLLTLSA